MRVTGGEIVGRRLKAPARGVRPTADRVRESVFMILTSRLPGARVLDLYAGSGALGIEALSRGAMHCLFVEEWPEAARVLQANLETLALADRATVAIAPVERWLARAASGHRPFDLVLVDPPYDAPGIGDVLGAIAKQGLIAPGGVLVWEHDRRAPPPPAGFNAIDERRYGDTVVTFLAPDSGVTRDPALPAAPPAVSSLCPGLKRG
jgi:16S rRNA (guanine(966)-N(2))-methyltransferase RsmD